jgi:hypothetical protein
MVRVFHRALCMPTLPCLVAFLIVLGSGAMGVCGPVMLLGGFPVQI